MAPIKLYHLSGSPPSRNVLLTIRNLNLEVDIKIVDFMGGEHLTPEYLKMNPQHTVPTLDDNGFYLAESKAISKYLVDKYDFGSSLYPKDLKERARIDQRLFFDAATLFPIARSIIFPILIMNEKTVSEDKKRQLHQAIEIMEKFLENSHEWFTGDKPTLADLSFLSTYATFVHMGVDLSKYEKLNAWYKRCQSLPGYEENEEGAMMLGEQFKKVISEKIKNNELLLRL